MKCHVWLGNVFIFISFFYFYSTIIVLFKQLYFQKICYCVYNSNLFTFYKCTLFLSFLYIITFHYCTFCASGLFALRDLSQQYFCNIVIYLFFFYIFINIFIVHRFFSTSIFCSFPRFNILHLSKLIGSLKR